MRVQSVCSFILKKMCLCLLSCRVERKQHIYSSSRHSLHFLLRKRVSFEDCLQQEYFVQVLNSQIWHLNLFFLGCCETFLMMDGVVFRAGASPECSLIVLPSKEASLWRPLPFDRSFLHYFRHCFGNFEYQEGTHWTEFAGMHVIVQMQYNRTGHKRAELSWCRA